MNTTDKSFNAMSFFNAAIFSESHKSKYDDISVDIDRTSGYRTKAFNQIKFDEFDAWKPMVADTDITDIHQLSNMRLLRPLSMLQLTPIDKSPPAPLRRMQ